MNATTSQPLASMPSGRSPVRATSATRLLRVMTKRRQPRGPGVPLTLNRPEQFGNSFRYPDGSWFHCC